MKKTLYFTLIILLVFSGVVFAQNQPASEQVAQNQTEQYTNKQFVYDLTEGGVLSQSTLMNLQENATRYNQKHDVEFYTQVVSLNETTDLREGLLSLAEQFDEGSLGNKAVVLFIYDEMSGQYKLFIDDKLQNKLNYYMIYNFMSEFEQELGSNTLDQALNNKVERLMDYFMLATEATVAASQLEVNYEKAQSLNEIEFYNLNQAYQEALNSQQQEQQEQVQEEPEQQEPYEDSGTSMVSIIIIIVIILLVILLIVGLIIFLKKRNEVSSDEIVYEEVEEIEDEEEYLD